MTYRIGVTVIALLNRRPMSLYRSRIHINCLKSSVDYSTCTWYHPTQSTPFTIYKICLGECTQNVVGRRQNHFLMWVYSERHLYLSASMGNMFYSLVKMPTFSVVRSASQILSIDDVFLGAKDLIFSKSTHVHLREALRSGEKS